jgi:hypothetical protein
MLAARSGEDGKSGKDKLRKSKESSPVAAFFAKRGDFIY